MTSATTKKEQNFRKTYFFVNLPIYAVFFERLKTSQEILKLLSILQQMLDFFLFLQQIDTGGEGERV